MENMLTNPVNPAIIFHDARKILSAGILRTCYWPVLAFDCNNNLVSLDDDRATLFTPSGAVIRALMNYCDSKNNLVEKASVYIEEIAKYFPETHMHKYELPTAFDLVCLRKTDEEILSAFEGAIEKIAKNGGRL